MAETIHYRFTVRGGTAAALAARNEIPLARELVAETDTGKMKLGDGATRWNDLPYSAAGGGGALIIVDEPSAFSADPETHEGRGTYVRAAGDITFGGGMPYEPGHLFNIRATADLSLIGDGVTLLEPFGGSLQLRADMAVTVVFVGHAVAEVIGQTELVGPALDAESVKFDNTASGLAAIDVQAAIDEIAAAAGISDMLAVVSEPLSFVATPGIHAGKSRYIRAAGDVVFDSSESYLLGHVFNVRAVDGIALVGAGVTLSATHGGTLELSEGMAVTIIMTSPTTADVIGLTVSA